MTSFESLKPYRSYLLMQVKREDQDLDALDNQLVPDMEALLRDMLDSALDVQTRQQMTEMGEVNAGFIHYTEKRKVAWSIEELFDILQELVVVVRRGKFLAVYASNSRVYDKIISETDSSAIAAFNLIVPMPRGRINAAFLDGDVRTLWLGGIHKRTSIKADSKVISGIDLRDAIDPIEDQTYKFTSARCVPKDDIDGVKQVGATPEKSKLWIGPAKRWCEFVGTAEKILGRLEKVNELKDSPFAVLSTPIDDISQVNSAFDLALIPPYLVDGDATMDDETKAIWKRWTEDANYVIQNPQGSSFDLAVELDGAACGSLRFDLQRQAKFKVKYEITEVPGGNAASLAEAKKCMKHSDCLNVWYESEHTVSNGSVYSMRYRDMQFGGIQFHDFTGFDVSKEKPSDLTDAVIGSEDSLFCWVRNGLFSAFTCSPDSWLACNDGSGEVADFICVDPASATLRLVHVKGANSSTLDREISVAAFEVVCSQAIKNLRHLDPYCLSRRLGEGACRKVSDLVWRNGALADKNDLISYIDSLGANITREVVIVQPHIRKTIYDQARANPTTQDGKRLQLLDTLLLGTQSHIQALGVQLRVVCCL